MAPTTLCDGLVALCDNLRIIPIKGVLGFCERSPPVSEKIHDGETDTDLSKREAQLGA